MFPNFRVRPRKKRRGTPEAFDEYRRRLSHANRISEFLAAPITVSGVSRKSPSSGIHECRKRIESVTLECIAPSATEMSATLSCIQRVHNRPEGERSKTLHQESCVHAED